MDDKILDTFSIPDTEISAEMNTGDHGKLTIDVEVISRIDGRTIFRKHNRVVPEGNFRPENAKQMRERLLDKQPD